MCSVTNFKFIFLLTGNAMNFSRKLRLDVKIGQVMRTENCWGLSHFTQQMPLKMFCTYDVFLGYCVISGQWWWLHVIFQQSLNHGLCKEGWETVYFMFTNLLLNWEIKWWQVKLGNISHLSCGNSHLV